MSSMFDPAQFLDTIVEESNSTKVEPCPPGEFQAQIESVEARPWKSKDDPTKSGVALDIKWSIQDQGVLSLLGVEKKVVKQGIMLDFTDGGQLDMGKGKNVALGRLREAVGLNTPGQPFGFRMLEGRMAKVLVKHEPAKDDPSLVYDRITAVTTIS